MRKMFATVALCAISLVSLRADVTVITKMSMEGAAAAMMQPGQLPVMTMRIKGLKSRSDIETGGMTVTAITDLEAGQVIMLMPNSKVAQVITPASVASVGPTALSGMEMSLKPTGKSQVIDGVSADEHTFKVTIDMAAAGGAQMPPEALAMMKDVRMVMSGSMWVARKAPGAEEFMGFYKKALDSKLLTAIAGMQPGQPGGMDKLLEASASAPGIPYLTEMTMQFEGSGEMVAAMSQMGPMKMIQKVSSVSTETLSDDLFKLPEGYTVEKK